VLAELIVTLDQQSWGNRDRTPRPYEHEYLISAAP